MVVETINRADDNGLRRPVFRDLDTAEGIYWRLPGIYIYIGAYRVCMGTYQVYIGTQAVDVTPNKTKRTNRAIPSSVLFSSKPHWRRVQKETTVGWKHRGKVTNDGWRWLNDRMIRQTPNGADKHIKTNVFTTLYVVCRWNNILRSHFWKYAVRKTTIQIRVQQYYIINEYTWTWTTDDWSDINSKSKTVSDDLISGASGRSVIDVGE